MSARVLIALLMLCTIVGRCQVEPAASGGSPAQDENHKMRTPPPVSGDPYPVATLYEMRSNYFRAQFTFSPSYTDHVVASSSAAAGADYVYTLWTNLEGDSRSSRSEQRFAYHPSITLYQRTSARNDVSHEILYEMKYSLTDHVQLSLRDYFQRSSNVFNDPYFSPGQSVSGSVQYPSNGAIAPYAQRQNATGAGQVNYQYSTRSMIGASGNFSKLDYLDRKQVKGLCDSASRGGSGFYNHRLSASQYLGATYQYMSEISCPDTMESTTVTHTVYFYFTKYFPNGLSLSVAGGPQHYDMAFAIFPASGSWTPYLNASAGWQRYRSSFAASYTRLVEGGGGLIGTFHSTRANGSFARQLAKQWRLRAAAGYQNHDTVNSLFGSSSNGYTVDGSITFTRTLGEHLKADFGYQRLHQRYDNIPVLASTPDVNRAYISLSYDFSRPLGR